MFARISPRLAPVCTEVDCASTFQVEALSNIKQLGKRVSLRLYFPRRMPHLGLHDEHARRKVAVFD